MAKLVDVRSPSTRTVSGTRRQRTGLPTVTVLVPCYNYGRYLPRCVKSILSQDGVAVDVLVIDDASTDDSAEVAEQLANADPRVRIMRHAVNLGHIATYNEGISLMRGKYFALVSADDFLAPGSLSRAVDVLESDDGIAMVYGRVAICRHVDPDDCVHRERRSRIRAVTMDGTAWIEKICRLGWDPIASPEVVVRSEVQRRVGGYSAHLPHSADFEMWLRVATQGSVVQLVGPPQAYYRVHSASMARTTYGQKIADLRQRQAALESFFAVWSTRPPESDEWHRAARRHLASVAISHACDIIVFGLPEDVDEYLAFVTSLDVDYTTLADWRRYRALRRDSGSRSARAAVRAGYVTARCHLRKWYHALGRPLERWL